MHDFGDFYLDFDFDFEDYYDFGGCRNQTRGHLHAATSIPNPGHGLMIYVRWYMSLYF